MQTYGGRSLLVGVLVTVLLAACPRVCAADAQTLESDHTDGTARQIAALDFDQLLDMKVTLASRTPEKWFDSASAMYVITREDIRRSGLNLMPELLRLAPGVHVAHLDANKWKISIRGFNERFSSKLLVLIDGRIVYTPLFSGVYWDIQDPPVEDIDRIEVVRGPGGALWGSNAVNGIINVVTRSAAATRGALVSATAGSGATNYRLLGRYGFGSEDFNLRVHGKYHDHDPAAFPHDGRPDLGDFYAPGDEAQDGWHQADVGVRGDWQAGDRDRVSFFGTWHDGQFGQTRVAGSLGVRDTVEVSGLYGGAVWQRTLSADSDLALHLFYDHTERGDGGLWEKRDTYTADFQHRFRLASHEVLWGGEYRTTRDETQRRSTVFFDPARRTLNRGAFFVQDRIDLGEQAAWALTLGSKFEVNNLTDFEYQPSVRLAWTPSPAATWWAAVSRAVRTPSRANSDLQIEPIPGMVVPLGNPDLESERVMAYELGVRQAVSGLVWVDVAAFFNDYDRLIDGDTNAGAAEMAGGEITTRAEITHRWTLAAGYSYIHQRNSVHVSFNGDPVRHLANLRSYYDLPANLELDAAFYHASSWHHDIPAYTRVDLRLGWLPTGGIDLSVAVQNLLDEYHIESRGGTRVATDVPRSFVATVRWRP